MDGLIFLSGPSACWRSKAKDADGAWLLVPDWRGTPARAHRSGAPNFVKYYTPGSGNKLTFGGAGIIS